MEWKNYIVGLVDVLKQSRKLDEIGSLWWELQATGTVTKEKSKKLAKLTSETSEQVEYFRELFTDSFNFLKQDVIGTTRNKKLSPVEQALVTQMANDIGSLRFFSDMVVFYKPFGAENELLTRFRIAGMLSACMGILTVEFKSGTFFRGGIEIGAGTELDNGDIYGPVLNEAYKLEKKIAEYPRVVVGKKVSDLIQTEVQTSAPGEYLNEVLARVNDFCKKMICQDDDGQIIVDYLGERAVELNGSRKSKVRDFMKRTKAKIKDELKTCEKKEDQKWIKRYERLLTYYQSRARLWE